MSVEIDLADRSRMKCELCGSAADLGVHAVHSGGDKETDRCLMICSTCSDQIQHPDSIDLNHWRCLNESIWSPVPAVQVVAWRILNRLRSEGWAQDLLETAYLEDHVREWAESGASQNEDNPEPTLDSNGAILNKGDSVTLIKDLVVKGGGFTAKRGTTVKNIGLTSNPKHVEGRVNGTQIVLVSAFLKKVT